MMKEKAIIVSGYFNPLHKGHLDLFKKAKSLGDKLWVIVNSDFQRVLKGSKPFMDENERLIIIQSIKYVDYALISNDRDKTQCYTLQQFHDMFSDKYDLAFANGGDQNNDTIPEKEICDKLGIKLLDGLGDKIQSSSWILKNNNMADISKCSGEGCSLKESCKRFTSESSYYQSYIESMYSKENNKCEFYYGNK